MKLLHVVGARPNFMKIAPIVDAMRAHAGVVQTLVHTGQHYDDDLSRVFFEDLEIPEPDIHLGVGSGSHGVQTARVMMELESVFLRERPDRVVVVGDVNSTLAAALTASKLTIPVAHVEAGLRSFDRTMPEEINRIVTDALSDLLFTTEKSGDENLIREGIQKEKVFFVGNVMIDTLLKFREKARRSPILEKLKLAPGGYAALTLHRPSSVDQPDRLRRILKALFEVAGKIPLVFPCHPRTWKQIQAFGLQDRFRSPGLPQNHGILLIEPLGYLDFLHLMSQSRFLFTDSGGIQEETTILGIPCLTLRENTERPATVQQGTNTLVGYSEERIVSEAMKILNGNGKRGRVPELWDGRAAFRIAEVMVRS